MTKNGSTSTMHGVHEPGADESGSSIAEEEEASKEGVLRTGGSLGPSAPSRIPHLRPSPSSRVRRSAPTLPHHYNHMGTRLGLIVTSSAHVFILEGLIVRAPGSY
jgi:hypothetical protein